MPRKTVFLDRDGTINVDLGYVYRPEDWRFTDRAVEAIARLRRGGFAVAVVTNQSGIAAGYYSPEDLHALHRHMADLLALEGAHVDAIAYCPHAASENCRCRKPRTGMLEQIEAALGDSVDRAASWTIGDKPSDMEFGRTLGTRTALLRSSYWVEEELPARPDLVAESLFSAAIAILAGA